MFDFIFSIPALIFFIVGIVFLIIEMFTPGLGVAGGIGAICLIIAVAFQANSFEQALFLLVLVFVIIAIFAIIFYKSATKGKISKSSIILKDQITREGNDYTALIGCHGVALTDLRPSGTAKIDQKPYSVVAQSSFISAGEMIEVINVDGLKIVVERINFNETMPDL